MNEKIGNIKMLIQKQIIQITDPLVKSALENILTEPIRHLREWDYSNDHEKFECWTIAIDESSDTSINYSEFRYFFMLPSSCFMVIARILFIL
jgi:hypothetical protein